MNEKVSRLIGEYSEYARKCGFMLNPDKRMVEQLVRGLLHNEKNYGKRYCPCRRTHTDKDVCPCVYHKMEIERDGNCHCFLFVRKE